MVTAHRTELVQESFAQILPLADAAAANFYERLFALAPDTRVLFRHDMAEQGRKLFLTLATVVDALDDLDSILPAADALAVRHVRYGAREEHYAVVGAALLDTLHAMLGGGLDPATREAWMQAYGILSGRMIETSRRAIAASRPRTRFF
jgi:hemoglobin-like flavoprotein